MEFNNSAGTRLPSHQLIFFQNNTSHLRQQPRPSQDIIDEQEVPQIQQQEEDELDEEMQTNEHVPKTKHPFTSSELFNAFNNKGMRENKSYIGADKWIKDFSPNKEHKNIVSRGQSVLQNDDFTVHQNSQNPQFGNYQQQTKQQNNQQKIFFGPLQIDSSNNQNKSGLIDDDSHYDMEEEEHDNHDKYYNQEHLMTDQDFDGHQHDDYQEYQDDNKHQEDEEASEQSEEQNNSQEGNVPISSKSISPDKEVQAKKATHNKSLYQQENEEDIRESYLRSSNKTGVLSSSYNDMPFNNNSNMIVERSDRFVIFKMVPQGNNMKQSHNSFQSQATPAMGDKYRQQQRNQVEEILSDEEGKSSQYERMNFKHSDIHQDFQNQILDESCQDEHSISQNDIKSLKNQLVNQSIISTKPPIIRKTVGDGGHSVKNQKAQKLIAGFNKHQSSNQVVQDCNMNDSRQEMNQYRKSSTQNSCSSYNKFTNLQKLEKKNLQEEFLDTAEFTMAKNLKFSVVDNNNNAFGKPSQSAIEPIRLTERRQSDGIVIRQSLIQQQNQFMQGQTLNSNINTANTAANDSISNDPETELLKMEYMKLKKTLNKLKNEPQQTARKNQSKQGRQEMLEQQLQQMKPQVVQSYRMEGAKSKKNLKLEQYTTSNILSSNVSDDENNKPQFAVKNNKGIFSQQQSTKAKDARGKKLFKQEQPKKVMKRDLSKNQLSNRMSPNQQTNKKPIRTHQRQHSKFNKVEYGSEHSLSHSSRSCTPEKSYRTYNKGPNNKTNNAKSQGKQIRSKHKSRPQRNESSQDEDDKYNSDYYHDNSANNKHQNDTYCDHSQFSREDSYYDSNEEGQEDSNDYSDSNSESRSQNQRKDKGRGKRTNDRKGNKGGKQKAAQKDRKLKININMNGAQLSRQARQDMQNSQDDYLQQQRQLLQQQQYMLAMAQQYPQQQLLLQQQLALQQQLLLQQQPSMQPNQFLNHQHVHSGIESQNQQIQQQTASSIPALNLKSNVPPAKRQENFPTSLLQKNLSGNNLNQYQKRTIPGEVRSISPSRIQTNNYVGNPSSSLISPRDGSASQRQQQQENYLHQLKNKFLTGKASTNETEYTTQTVSRNQTNQISQNNSSPSPLQQQQQQREPFIRDQQPFRIEPQSQRFEEARNYQGINYFNQEQANNNKHGRTNSLMDFKNNKLARDTVQHTFQLKNNDYHPYDDDHIPILQHKKTGDFGNQQYTSPQFPLERDIFQKAKEESLSPNNSGENCDLSMDEGVKASNAHETLLRSPKANAREFKISLVEKNDKRGVDTIKLDFTKKNIPKQQQFQRASTLSKTASKIQSPAIIKQVSNKSEQHNNDQDKKGPQALWIGFEDENQLKDPFQNKPALKKREQQPKLEKVIDLVQRSKSTKGTEPKPFAGPKTTLVQKKDQKGKHDKQLRSPITKNESSKKQQVQQSLNQNLLQNKESPLKRVVLDMKQKEIEPNQKPLHKKKTPIQVFGKNEDEEVVCDPKHNKAVAIEIFDKETKPPGKEVSLADMFKAKKKEALLNLEKPSKQQQQDQDMQDKPVKQEKSKQELFELRKKMMKSKVTKREDHFGGDGDSTPVAEFDLKGDKKNQKKEADNNLMVRLAMGQKTQVDKKEMKKLTSKNYQKLPEIQRKKEEEKKKEENQARKVAALEYNKQLNEKRRALLKKKKSLPLDE